MSVALLGSVGHCIGMCGGFVMAYSSAKIDASTSNIRQLLSHITYNIGRVSAYIFLGILFGSLGSIFSFSSQSRGYFYFLIGLMMILMGLSMWGKLKFLTSLESSIAFNSTIKKLFSFLIHSKSFWSFYGLGILNGFLPCGLVYFFLASAAITGSWFWGGVTMAIFGISTMPSLIGIGFIIGFLKSSGFREIMIKLASFVIIGYGLYMAYLGYCAVIA
ncbi:MAG: sulfite exporter TauE/SafE family protein [Sulfurospirillaceae bacterium]|nr:sulfite exporter TauE/SafE family protein [Sulfurospirillaceae bacterium]